MEEKLIQDYLTFMFPDKKIDVLEYNESVEYVHVIYLYKYKEGEFKDVGHRDFTNISILTLTAWVYNQIN